MTTSTAHKIEWVLARTMAHLHIDGNFSGISVHLGKGPLRIGRVPAETLRILGLPALPEKEG